MEEKQVFTAKEAAEYLGYSVRTIYDFLYKGAMRWSYGKRFTHEYLEYWKKRN